jgi:hypothetical protein
MKRLIFTFLILAFIGGTSPTQSSTGSGLPLKYISSCEIDLNNDGKPDIALLVETSLGRELIVLMRTGNGYKAFLISNVPQTMHLSCHFGKILKESEAFNNPKVYETPGTYIKLHEPEGAAIAYFWNGSSFTKVWIAD